MTRSVFSNSNSSLARGHVGIYIPLGRSDTVFFAQEAHWAVHLNLLVNTSDIRLMLYVKKLIEIHNPMCTRLGKKKKRLHLNRFLNVINAVKL